MIFLTPRIIRNDDDQKAALGHLQNEMQRLQKRIGKRHAVKKELARGLGQEEGSALLFVLFIALFLSVVLLGAPRLGTNGIAHRSRAARSARGA